jgi:enamine deaminase RidA (YjgF/YER057c/UK114 family)
MARPSRGPWSSSAAARRSCAALLEEEGGGLTDIVQGTRFLKEAAAAPICDASARTLGLPALPVIDVVADVCRPELLVEIEAIAVV